MDEPPVLLTVPNVSVGVAGPALDAVTAALTKGGLRLLDVHVDADHGRSVLSLAGRQGDVARALADAARAAADLIDLTGHLGLHPHVGALDVAPVVYLAREDRGAAVAEALTAAGLIGEDAALPVFLYGDLATDPARRERAALRAGGPAQLAQRMASGELRPDHGPAHAHPTAGSVLVTARPPLVAVNVDLGIEDTSVARAIAAELREAGGGPSGVRAMGLHLAARQRSQVSMNVHDPLRVPVAQLVRRILARAPVAEIEFVGLVPRAALEGLDELGVPLRDFDRPRRVIEEAVRPP